LQCRHSGKPGWFGLHASGLRYGCAGLRAPPQQHGAKDKASHAYQQNKNHTNNNPFEARAFFLHGWIHPPELTQNVKESLQWLLMGAEPDARRDTQPAGTCEAQHKSEKEPAWMCAVACFMVP
jgi:hypothetical protein